MVWKFTNKFYAPIRSNGLWNTMQMQYLLKEQMHN